MLRSGAASFRAEQTLCRVARALGVEQIEAYVTPTGIIASVYSGSEHRTQIVRVMGIGVDLNRVSALETLSRQVTATDQPVQLLVQIEAIEKLPRQYPAVLVVITVGLACGALAVILGGGLLEFAAAAVASTLTQALRMRLIALHLNPIPLTVICSTLASTLGVILVRLMSAPKPEIAVVASVLLLVPGVPLITSLLDLLRFYLLSGLARGAYAGLILISIGLGVVITLAITGFAIL